MLIIFMALISNKDMQHTSLPLPRSSASLPEIILPATRASPQFFLDNMELSLAFTMAFFSLFSIATSYRIICAGICTCDIKEEFSIAECNGKSLTKLPIFEPYLAYTLTRIYLNNNQIIKLQKDVLTTWRSVRIIDLARNPIDCGQLSKIPSSVRIISDCRDTTTFGSNHSPTTTAIINVQSTITGQSLSYLILKLNNLYNYFTPTI